MNLARRPVAFSAVLLTAGALGAGVAFAAAGDQDPSFNGGAPSIVDFPGITDDSVTQLAIGPDGSIVVAGPADDDGWAGVALGRLNASGQPVGTFGEDGALTDFSVFGVDGSPQALAVAADGDLLVGLRARGALLLRQPSLWGGEDDSTEADFAVARYGADGTFEGVSRIDLPGIFDNAEIAAIEPQADGGTLVLGSIRVNDEGHGSFVRVLLDADGNPDPSFDGDGIAIDESVDADAFAAGAQGAGNTIFAGNQSGFGGSVLKRYLADGSADPTYGGAFDQTPPAPMFGGDVLPDGSVLGIDNEAVRRFTGDGKPDGAYGGGDGTADLSFLGGGDLGSVDVVAQADGKAVVIAHQGDGIVVGRLTADGAPDPTFGTGGTVVLPQPDGMAGTLPGGIALQPDGKVVAAGFGGMPPTSTDEQAALVRGERRAFVVRLDGDPKTTTTTTTTDTTTSTTATTQTATAATAATTPAPAPVAAQSSNPLPVAKSCVSRRSFKIRLRIPRGAKATKATVKVNGKQVKVITGSRLRAAIDLRGLPKGKSKVSITVKLTDGSTLTGARTYRTCTPKRAGGVPKL
jgi:uncharacterized delta-60 repeat protein